MKQLSLFGTTKARRKRKKAGRPPRAERIGFMRHAMRPAHDASHPVLVTIRCVDAAPSLRSEVLARAIAAQVERAIRRGIGVVHYSIQDNHLHLMVEAHDRTGLARGMQLLFSRIAFEVNRLAERHGRLFRDRHHRRALTTPTETRNALVYVLFNGRKHRLQKGDHPGHILTWIDPFSSTAWFDGWSRDYAPTRDHLARTRAGPNVCGARPRTWLAREGWQRGGGLVRYDELPRSRR